MNFKNLFIGILVIAFCQVIIPETTMATSFYVKEKNSYNNSYVDKDGDITVDEGGDITTSYVNDNNSRAYDFRGLQLGSPLYPIASFEFPGKPGSRAKFICSNKQSKFVKQPYDLFFILHPLEEEMGVFLCQWAKKNPSAGELPTDKDWISPTINVGTGFSKEISYYFIPPPDSPVPRLFKIHVPLSHGFFEEIAKALTNKFGLPIIIEGEVQNKMGAKFSNTTLKWKNDESTISLFERDGKLYKSKLVYVFNKLAAIHSARAKKFYKEQAADNL